MMGHDQRFNGWRMGVLCLLGYIALACHMQWNGEKMISTRSLPMARSWNNPVVVRARAAVRDSPVCAEGGSFQGSRSRSSITWVPTIKEWIDAFQEKSKKATMQSAGSSRRGFGLGMIFSGAAASLRTARSVENEAIIPEDLPFLRFKGADGKPAETTRQVSTAKTCDVSISHLRDPSGAEVFLVGTAHISDVSAKLASDVLDSVEPDLIMVELDTKRISKVGGDDGSSAPNDAQQMPKFLQKLQNFFTALQHPKQLILGAVVGNVLSKMYQGMGEEGFTVGGEFTAAFDHARETGVPVLLGDRPVDITFSRLGDALTKSNLTQLIPENSDIEELGISEASLENKEDLSAFIEQLKNRESVEKLQSYMKKKAPQLYDALIGERDLYMSASILGALEEKKFKRVVGIVGFAHLTGIEAALGRARGFQRVDMCTK
mmetsp:Transcript_23550/g.35241  ORF Transcript_23550/g.35241 Transcript_23550/m.35241 type:complete len:433 (+) Transcript_23550:1330-2628(+)